MTEAQKSNLGPPAFEQGPIRPPSEARSLLLRVTRNCPWNQCEFCPVYKGTRFTRRTVEEVESDIRAMAFWHERAVEESWRLGFGGRLDGRAIQSVYARAPNNPYLTSILLWLSGGGQTAFLQDADNLILAPDDLAAMLRFLRQTFPAIGRVTTYSRSRTLAKRGVADLVMLREAGLDRVHVGFESGSDAVLEMVKKGVDGETHIAGGRRVMEAGLELSVYVMPGLGGRERWEEHARETARVLSAVGPHFIRIRQLGLREGIILFERMEKGEFQPLDDVEVARELRLMIAELKGIGSYVVSDHVLNLLPEIEGKLPDDRDRMLAKIDAFLGLDPEDQMTYVVGRRLGFFDDLSGLDDPVRAGAARSALMRLRERGGPDVGKTIREAAGRFI
ncbi:MAG TPA: radical SAM protein [bacterium]|nr:radical SAM protein [bacterium]